MATRIGAHSLPIADIGSFTKDVGKGSPGQLARLGPHTLPINHIGTYTKTLIPKGTPVDLPGRLGPHMSVLSSLNSNDDVIVTLTGAPMRGEVNAIVGVQAFTRNQLRADVLPASTRDFTSKGLANVVVTLTGAAMRGQGEQLEGATTAITIDGAAMNALGDVSSGELTDRAEAVSHLLYKISKRRLVFATATSEDSASLQSFIISVSKRWLSITLTTGG